MPVRCTVTVPAAHFSSFLRKNHRKCFITKGPTQGRSVPLHSEAPNEAERGAVEVLSMISDPQNGRGGDSSSLERGEIQMSGGPGHLQKMFRHQYSSLLSTRPHKSEPDTVFWCDLLESEGLGRLPEPCQPPCVIKPGRCHGGCLHSASSIRGLC